MNPDPPEGALPRSPRLVAYPPFPQLDEKLACPLLIARSEPMADASLPDMRARRRPGTAIAAMMPMIATTINSSMRVKPLASRIFFMLQTPLEGWSRYPRHVGGPCPGHEQPECQTSSFQLLVRKT